MRSARPAYQRPFVSSTPIDPLLRDKLDKLERIMADDYKMDTGAITRIMNCVFENFIEKPAAIGKRPVRRDVTDQSSNKLSIINK